MNETQADRAEAQLRAPPDPAPASRTVFRSSSLRAGCRAGMARSVLVPSSVPSSVYARLRADARERRDGTTGGTITHGDHSPGACAPALPEDLDNAARVVIPLQVPLKLRELPACNAHEFTDFRPFIGSLT